MTYYDKNVIIEFLNGDGDGIILDGTGHLGARVSADSVVTVPFTSARPFGLRGGMREALNAALSTLTSESRLYLRGHGNWKERTLGGWAAREVAGALGWYLRVSPKIISVTGCQCARAVAPGAESNSLSSFVERKQARGPLLAASKHSFVGLLHFRLRQYGITSDMVGRVFPVTVIGGPRWEEDGRWTAGQKVTAVVDEEQNHRPYSKIRFRWNDGEQEADWLAYTKH